MSSERDRHLFSGKATEKTSQSLVEWFGFAENVQGDSIGVLCPEQPERV